jgi:hypothetical protein
MLNKFWAYKVTLIICIQEAGTWFETWQAYIRHLGIPSSLQASAGTVPLTKSSPLKSLPTYQ